MLWSIYLLTTAELVFGIIIWLVNLVDYLNEKDEETYPETFPTL